MAQQLELDFGIATSPPLTCSIGSALDTANYTYIGNSTVSINNNIKQFSFPTQTSDLTLTRDDLLFTKNGQTKGLFEMISKIEERLSILVPDPAKLKQFEALKQAYKNYKTLEAICFTNNE
jgi:hypothetical protein